MEASAARSAIRFSGPNCFFGLSKPDGEVTKEECQQCLAQHITPRFPEGLTVVTGLGQCSNASGIII
jgi:Protein of unknown function (DUF3574)